MTRRKQPNGLEILHKLADRAGGRAALADRLGVAPSTVGHWFTGERWMGRENMLRIEAEFGVPAPDMFYREAP